LTEAFWSADTARHDEVRAEVAANLVFVVGYQQSRFAEARRWATAAESVLNRMGGHDLLRAWLCNDLGAVIEMEGHREEALKLHRQAIMLKEQVLGKRHPDVAISEANLAIALHSMGQHEEALQHLEKSIAIEKDGLGAGHPDLALQLNNRGEILRMLGRYGDARASLEQARSIWERELGPDNAWLAYALTGIGETLLAEGRANEALVPLARALKIRQAQDSDAAHQGETMFAYARALWDSNRDHNRAIALGEDARSFYERTPAKDKLREVEAWLRNVRDKRPPRLAQR
jgi:tetratricopeptide (TPR) repeat protein